MKIDYQSNSETFWKKYHIRLTRSIKLFPELKDPLISLALPFCSDKHNYIFQRQHIELQFTIYPLTIHDILLLIPMSNVQCMHGIAFILKLLARFLALLSIRKGYVIRIRGFNTEFAYEYLQKFGNIFTPSTNA